MFDAFQTSMRDAPRRPPVRTLYDVFCNIRDDEGEHVRTMLACQARAARARPARLLCPAPPASALPLPLPGASPPHRATPTPPPPPQDFTVARDLAYAKDRRVEAVLNGTTGLLGGGATPTGSSGNGAARGSGSSSGGNGARGVPPGRVRSPVLPPLPPSDE